MSTVAPVPEMCSIEKIVELCRQKQWQTVIELVRANPEVVKTATAGRGVLPPLHAACENGPPIQVIKVLLNTNPQAVQDKSGIHDRLPLHCILAGASTYPLSETVVSTLVEAFPVACRVADKQGNLPIHLACQAANVSDNIFTSILSMYPEGAYARNFGGNYPLHIAASNKDVNTKRIALAALDRGTLYASISKMTSIRLYKEHDTEKKSLEKIHADKINKMESRSKEERSKLIAQINSLKSLLDAEKKGNQSLQEEMKALKVHHKENMSVAVQKEQTKASDMEKELRSDLAEVQLNNMDLLEQVENVQADLDTSNEKVRKQAEEIEMSKQELDSTTKTLVDTEKRLELTNADLQEAQDKLASTQVINEDKCKCILHLESSLHDAKETILALVKEHERMKTNMSSQRDALAALLMGYDSFTSDAGSLAKRMEGLVTDIDKATTGTTKVETSDEEK